MGISKREAESLRDKGWNVYPYMLTKIQTVPFAKCVAFLERGKVKRVLWSPANVPDITRKKFLKELDGIKD